MSLFIGVMSGTSVDAIDTALVEAGEHATRLVACRTHPIPERLRARIQALITSKGAAPALEAWSVDAELGTLYAEAVTGLLESCAVDAAAVTAIGCHGQTVFHDPDSEPPVTVQLGDPNRITAGTGIPVAADFRRVDLALGGHGAPLAPGFHAACLRKPGHGRVIVNIGGIANTTLLHADEARPVIGFDTGPGNTLLDFWAARHLGRTMDLDGAWASRGVVVEDLLAQMLRDPYFARTPPKSTGRELFDATWLDRQIATHGSTLEPVDVQRTLCELTAASVADAVVRHAPWADEILVSGGGAHNPVVMAALSHRLSPRPVTTTAIAGVDPDWVEAIAFAWLAARTCRGEPGNLPSVTGARRAAVLGGIFRG